MSVTTTETVATLVDTSVVNTWLVAVAHFVKVKVSSTVTVTSTVETTVGLVVAVNVDVELLTADMPHMPYKGLHPSPQ